MWRFERYDEAMGRTATAQAPSESGERLGTFPRNQGTEKLRITLCEYNGHPYVAVRLWSLDPKSGEWWPTKKGTSIRMAEVRGFADALLSVAGDQPHQSRPGQAPAPRPVRIRRPEPGASPERSYAL